MDLDFSLLTFSPSHVNKNLKLPGVGKKFSKRIMSQRHHSAVETKGAVACQEKYTVAANLKSVQEKLPKKDYSVGDSITQSLSAVHDNHVIKSRVSKGKENRGIASYPVDLTSDSGRLGTSNAASDHRSCHRLFSDNHHENGPSRKKCSVDVGINSPNANIVDGLVSDMNVHISSCEKSSVSSGGRSTYFSCSQICPESSTVLISESSYSSVDRTCNKNKEDFCQVNDSVIVISDSSSTAITNSTSKKKVKLSLTSRTRDHSNSVQKVKYTIVVDTSDSENDILEASCDAPYRLTSNVRTPLCSDFKSQTYSNTKHEKVGGPIADLEFTHPSKPPHLFHTKYQDIEKWISEVRPLNRNDYDADKMLEGKRLNKTEKTENNTKNSVGLNSSAEEILDNLYGKVWRKKNVNPKRPQTEPCKKKCSRNVPISRQHTECKKQKAKNGLSITSSTDSEEFENFLKNIRQEFESTRRDSDVESDFIDDDVQDNSLGFYQGVFNSRDRKKDLLHSNWKLDKSKILRNVGACKRLSFSNSDNDVPSNEHNYDENHDTSKHNTNEKKLDDLKEKKNVKMPQKIIVSPIKKILRKETPKTVGQTKLNSCVNKQVISKFSSPVHDFLASLSAGIPSGQCHPEAQYYKSNFRKKKEELCSKLFKMYNDKVFDNKLPHDMLVEWNVRLMRTAGFCYNRRTVTSPGTKIRTSRIELSTKVCDTADRLRDTLIHELCHAATWVVDDVKDGHGPRWKAWARRAMRMFPELPPIKRCHDYSIQTKFTYRCTGCGYSIGRHSKSLDIATKRCGHCYGMFELLLNTRRKSGTIAQHTLKKRSPVGFARFVKENYSSVKQSRTDLRHGDVMRLLGQQFSAVKIGSEARKQ